MKQVDPATAAALAAFAAKGGTVTRLDAEASSGVTDRQWYAAARGQIDLRSQLNGSDDERRSERYLEAGREAKHCGASDSEALWLARMAGDMEAF